MKDQNTPMDQPTPTTSIPSTQRDFFQSWWRYRRTFALALSVLLLVLLGRGCSSCGNTIRSPFSGILPQGTPLIIEGTPRDVVNFLTALDIAEPAIGENMGLAQLPCERVLYAAIPPDNKGDFTDCKNTLMRSVNALEDQWTAQERYPDPSAVTLPACPLGGQMSYNSDGQAFTLSCQGNDHQTLYHSVDGLKLSAMPAPPLVFIAFQSNDEQWKDAAISKKHPDIKILASDPATTCALLEKVENPLTISYPRDSSLYVSVYNSSLPTFWNKLHIALPGMYTTITKNATTGVLSLRSNLNLDQGEVTPDLPEITKCLNALPQGTTRLAISSELADSLQLLPWLQSQKDGNTPQTFGVSTNAAMQLSQLMPTISSAYSGLTQAGFVAQYATAAGAQQGLIQSPWGDLTQNSNPQCAGTANNNMITIQIGDALPVQSERLILPKGPGPCQMGGQITLSSTAQNEHTYLFSGGLHKGKFWMEIASLLEG